MNPILTGLLVFLCVFGAGMLALLVRSMLPENHLAASTQDTVKLAMGSVATMAALVLGLLVASAKGSYDDQKSAVTLMASKIAFADRLLEAYGPESVPARKAFRESAEHMRDRLWPASASGVPQADPRAASAEAAYRALIALSPKNDEQRDLKARAQGIGFEVGQMRWVLFAQTSSSISMPLLVVVVCWFATLFFSFGLFAPRNGIVVVALLVAALAVAGAIFLVLEFDQPFGGLIQIPSHAMDRALLQLER